MEINWERLRARLLDEFQLGEWSIHGPSHWDRVERYGILLAEQSGGRVRVARLFALFHDVCRLSDGQDDEHGARGAALAERLRGTYFTVTDEEFALLHAACGGHTAGQLSDDPTIGACWDADRLDLWRANVTPKERFFSTEHARHLVRAGQIGRAYLPPSPQGTA